MTPSAPITVEEALERAVVAYTALAEVGEGVDDEWSYIHDLTEAWRERFDAVRASRGSDQLDGEVVAAVDAAIGEIGLIDDPHRAIDWLSTFPQVLLVSLGERP